MRSTSLLASLLFAAVLHCTTARSITQNMEQKGQQIDYANDDFNRAYFPVDNENERRAFDYERPLHHPKRIGKVLKQIWDQRTKVMPFLRKTRQQTRTTLNSMISKRGWLPESDKKKLKNRVMEELKQLLLQYQQESCDE